MSFKYRFQKILHLKENEKDQAYQLYQDSVKKFTEVAEELYKLMKKKEDLEQNQIDELVNGLSVYQIRHNQQFVLNLEKSIEHYQKLVINARKAMNWHEEKLKECNIEVKKYEKLKEKSYQVYLQMLKQMENKSLDNISTQQYFYREGS